MDEAEQIKQGSNISISLFGHHHHHHFFKLPKAILVLYPRVVFSPSPYPRIFALYAGVLTIKALL